MAKKRSPLPTENSSSTSSAKNVKATYVVVDTLEDGQITLYRRIRNGAKVPSKLNRSSIYLRHYQRKNPRKGIQAQRFNICLHTSNLDEARREAYLWWDQHREDLRKGIDTSGKSISQLMDLFIRQKAKEQESGNLSYSRLRQLKSSVSALQEFLRQQKEDQTPVGNIRPDEVFDDYILWRQKFKRSQKGTYVHRKTILEDIQILNQIWKWSQRKRYTDMPFFVDDLLRRVKQINRNQTIPDTGSRGALTRDTYRKLTNYMRRNSFLKAETPPSKVIARGRYEDGEMWNFYRRMMRDFVLIAANCGARTGELYKLRWRNIVPEGDQDSTITIIRTKTNEERRSLCLGCQDFFERWREITKPETEDELVFRSFTDRSRPVNPEYLNGYLRDICNELQLRDDKDKQVTFYTLRHTFITFRLSAGASVYSVSTMVGTSITMINKHYASRNFDNVKEGYGVGKPRKTRPEVPESREESTPNHNE